jgi:hypothetical protein
VVSPDSSAEHPNSSNAAMRVSAIFMVALSVNEPPLPGTDGEGWLG